MRENQRARTRQAIVRAAGALFARGEKPSLDDIAAEARVSRATAYRYFPGLDGDRFDPRRNALSPSSYTAKHPNVKGWPTDNKAHPERSIRNGDAERM